METDPRWQLTCRDMQTLSPGGFIKERNNIEIKPAEPLGIGIQKIQLQEGQGELNRVSVSYCDDVHSFRAVWDCAQSGRIPPTKYLLEYPQLGAFRRLDQERGDTGVLKIAYRLLCNSIGSDKIDPQALSQNHFHLIELQKEHWKKHNEFLDQAKEYLPGDVIESIAQGNMNDLIHYLGNAITKSSPNNHRILCAAIKTACPEYTGAQDMRQRYLQEKAEMTAIEWQIIEIDRWWDYNTWRTLDDPEMAASYAKKKELQWLLDQREKAFYESDETT